MRKIIVKKGNFQLLPKQKEFVDSDNRFMLYTGGVGSGKTKVGCYKSLKLATKLTNGRGIICRETYRQLEDTTKHEFIDMLKSKAGTIIKNYSRTDNYIELINGHKILFRSLDKEEKFRSLNADWIYVDEASILSEKFFKQLNSRLRNQNKFNKHWFFMTMNPNNQASWMYDYFILNEFKQDIKVITASSLENPYLPRDQVKYLRNMAKVDKLWYRRYVLGEWIDLEGLVYSAFNRDLHVKKIDLSKIQYVERACDYGDKNPFVILYFGVDCDDNIYLLDEIYLTETTIEQMLRYMQFTEKRFKEYNLQILGGVIDPSASGIKRQFAEKGIYFDSGSNDILAGIRKVKDYLYWDDKRKPRLYFDEKCYNTIREFTLYKYPEKKIEERNEEEKPLKVNDHAMDALRYYIMHRHKNYDKPVIATKVKREFVNIHTNEKNKNKRVFS